MTSDTIDRAYHEYTHHTQGFLNSTTLPYLARYPYYMVAEKLGWSDGIPMMQATKTREQFLNNYVGSTIESQAYSVGLLAKIRAMAAGLPSEAHQ